MSRASRPSLECLEGRIVLSDVNLTISTDRANYSPGQPVLLTLTETNVSDHDVNVIVGPTNDGFDVYNTSTSVWKSNVGIQPQFLAAETLKPGESITHTAVWDADTTPGTYRATSQVQYYGETAGIAYFNVGLATPQGPGTSTGSGSISPSNPSPSDQSTSTPITPVSSQPNPSPSNPVPTSPIGSAPVSTNTASKLNLGVRPDRSTAKLGQSIQLMLTETNTGHTAAPVLQGAQIVSAVVKNSKGQVVWRYHDARALPTYTGTLAAGASRKLAVAWDGQANIAGAGVTAGTYTVIVTLDGRQARTHVRLTR